MLPHSSLPAEYFEARYRAKRDPWNFENSEYERQKYAATLGSLSRPRYGRALEVGCSIGVFTEMLSERCDAVVAIDVSETALHACRARCKGKTHVTVRKAAVPGEWPEGRYDLMIFSEVLYYLNREDIAATARCAKSTLNPGAEVLFVHWLGRAKDPLIGDEAAELFIRQFAGVATVIFQNATDKYRLDLLQMVPADAGTSPGT
jgi:2-polyprenyl-3-methyl-5-hydroxy-6-metoxy-1,4-benzoquinol methylase